MFIPEDQNWPEFHLIWHLEYTSKSVNIANIENFGRAESSEGMQVGSKFWSNWAFVGMSLLKVKGKISYVIEL